MKSTMILGAAFAVMTTAMVLSAIAEQPLVANQNTADTNSFDVYIQKLKQLGQQDTQGFNTFQSDRTAELQKFGYSSASTNKTFSQLSAKACDLLSALKKPVGDSRESYLQFPENNRLLRQMFDECLDGKRLGR